MRPDVNRIEIVDEEMAKILRRKSPAERIAIGISLRASARRMLVSHLSSRHPEWSPEEILAEANWRFSGGAR